MLDAGVTLLLHDLLEGYMSGVWFLISVWWAQILARMRGVLRLFLSSFGSVIDWSLANEICCVGSDIGTPR